MTAAILPASLRSMRGLRRRRQEYTFRGAVCASRRPRTSRKPCLDGQRWVGIRYICRYCSLLSLFLSGFEDLDIASQERWNMFCFVCRMFRGGCRHQASVGCRKRQVRNAVATNRRLGALEFSAWQPHVCAGFRMFLLENDTSAQRWRRQNQVGV